MFPFLENRARHTITNFFFQLLENETDLQGQILVLDSPAGTGWRLAFKGKVNHSPEFKRVVMLAKGSTVLTSNMKITSKSNTAVNDKMNDIEYGDAVRKNHGALTSFSRMKGANRISILLTAGTYVRWNYKHYHPHPSHNGNKTLVPLGIRLPRGLALD